MRRICEGGGEGYADAIGANVTSAGVPPRAKSGDGHGGVQGLSGSVQIAGTGTAGRDRASVAGAAGPGAAAPRPRRLRRWLRWLIALPFLFVLASILQVATLRFIDPPFSAFMMIRQFEAWGSGDFGFRVAHDWRDLDEISPNLPVALVASEDQNFAEHFGFDLKAIEKARKNNERGRKVRGGSTISQQTAKNLFLWSGRSWIRKGVEAWYTLLLETLWPKSRIIEVYANIAEFGDGVYGAQAAARTYYRKDAR